MEPGIRGARRIDPAAAGIIPTPASARVPVRSATSLTAVRGIVEPPTNARPDNARRGGKVATDTARRAIAVNISEWIACAKNCEFDPVTDWPACASFRSIPSSPVPSCSRGQPP